MLNKCKNSVREWHLDQNNQQLCYCQRKIIICGSKPFVLIFSLSACQCEDYVYCEINSDATVLTSRRRGIFFFCHLSLSPSLFQNTSEFSYIFDWEGWVNSFSSVNSFKEEKNLKVIVAMETNFQGEMGCHSQTFNGI